MPPKRKSVTERDRSPAGRATPPVDAVRSVWAVVRGENYEGYNTIAMFSNRDQAVLCAKDSMSVGEWKEDVVDTRWEEGCFYIEIQEETLWASCAHRRQYMDREIEAAKARQESDRLERREAGD